MGSGCPSNRRATSRMSAGSPAWLSLTQLPSHAVADRLALWLVHRIESHCCARPGTRSGARRKRSEMKRQRLDE